MDRPARAPTWCVAGALLLACCATRSAGTGATTKASPKADGGTPAQAWEASTRSPQPLDDGASGSPCGASDRALARVAERVAARGAAGERLPDTAELAFALRSEGAPYVWPRAWTLEGVIEPELERTKLGEWLATFGPEGEKRCAVASRKTGNGRSVLAVVATRVLADLEPLPTRVSIGAWLDLRAVLLVPTERVEVVVLGPSGRPHAVLASFDGARARARFRADREGTWLVQVLATTANGPELAAEALVAAGNAPPETFDAAEAPGERHGASTATAADALLAMVNGARASESLAPVRRDGRLDRAALEHAESMRQNRALSHAADGARLGDRLARLSLHSAGENVAHATDLARAHRSLWRSPSHRENLLHPSFEIVGIGVAPDGDGTLWVCEIFAAPENR